MERYLNPLKQDLIDLENVQHIAAIETLIQLLRKRVGSPISHNALARDLQCSDKTVKRWLTILENMYVIFKVTPFHRNIARAILKAPKYYFYDTGQVSGDLGIKLENAAACALLKEAHFLEDCYGDHVQLHYLMTKEGKEVDFFITRNDAAALMMEVKWADGNLSGNFAAYDKYFPAVRKVQIVAKLDREKTYPNGIEIRRAHDWLADFTFN